MTSKEILDLIRDQILEVYSSQNMTCLSDNQYNYNGVNIMAVPNSQLTIENWNSYKNLRDIVNCNQDLMYFAANLFLYRPYINNPLKEVDTQTMKFPVFHYHQNIYDHRYCTYVSNCFEKAYNYWDRIGDLLYSFYPSIIPNIRSVDFSRVIDKIYEIGERDADFIWLHNFKQNEYSILNGYRKDVVHYYQYETSYHFEHISNSTKPDVITKIWKEKSELPEYFKAQLEISCEGCLRTYAYLNKVIQFRAQNPNSASPLVPVQPHV
ncbi:MAG: Cthe_2314 family HEPN domain-containing protein [Cyclobacteriaceae bacterium]